jgi:hypothetical protein
MVGEFPVLVTIEHKMGIFGHKFPNVLERYSFFPQKKN